MVNQSISSDIREMLNMIYDSIFVIKNTDLVVVEANHRYGLYDTTKNQLELPIEFKRFEIQGPSVTFTRDNNFRTSAVMYLKRIHQRVDVNCGIFSTRVIGDYKIFMTNQRYIYVVHRITGRIDAQGYCGDIHLTNNCRTANGLGATIEMEAMQGKEAWSLVVPLKGRILTLQDYLDKTYIKLNKTGNFAYPYIGYISYGEAYKLNSYGQAVEQVRFH